MEVNQSYFWIQQKIFLVRYAFNGAFSETTLPL